MLDMIKNGKKLENGDCDIVYRAEIDKNTLIIKRNKMKYTEMSISNDYNIKRFIPHSQLSAIPPYLSVIHPNSLPSYSPLYK